AYILAVLRVFNVATARQLRGFLAHLAPTLTIALPGQGTVAGSRPPKIAGRQGQVNRCNSIVDTLTLVLQSARLVQQGGVGTSVHTSCLVDHFRAQATDLGYTL